MKTLSTILTLLLLSGASAGALADQVKVAVAANFTAAMKEIARDFEQATGHTTQLSFGSTGKLYTQIKNGAPFEVFLAADQKRPQILVEQGEATDEFTYAIGKLVLWSADPERVKDGAKTLTGADFDKLAIANPKTAPYGAAAMEVIQSLAIDAMLEPKLVKGDNIAQTYQFVATQNAQLGFVAKAQIALDASGSSWEIPQEYYTPIRQDAVLLKKGKDNPAAVALMDYLQGNAAQAVIETYGYGVE